jgi:hypothetical protein
VSELPVIRLDLDPDQAYLINLALNRVGIWPISRPHRRLCPACGRSAKSGSAGRSATGAGNVSRA